MKMILIQVILTLFVLIGILVFFLSMSPLIQAGFSLVAIVLLLVVLSMVWPPDSPWAPWWKTSSKVARRVQKVAKLTEKDVLYELGSGDAESLITLAKEFGIRSVGVEIDPLRHYLATFAVWRHGVKDKVTLLKKNFFEVSLTPATVVYVYLVPKALLRLKEKMLKELALGTLVISYRYEIPFLEKVTSDTKENIHVYRIPRKKPAMKKKK